MMWSHCSNAKIINPDELDSDGQKEIVLVIMISDNVRQNNFQDTKNKHISEKFHKNIVYVFICLSHITENHKTFRLIVVVTFCILSKSKNENDTICREQYIWKENSKICNELGIWFNV